MDAEKLDDALASIEGMLKAAEEDLYDEPSDENDPAGEARRAAGARTAKVAYIKQAMGDLDDEGRRQLKEAMGLMETGGNKKPGAKDSAGGLDDEDLMDDLGSEDAKNAEFPPRREDEERVGALQAAVRKETGVIHKRLRAIEASLHRSKSRPLVAKMSRTRAAHGWSSERLVDFERRMLNASYPEVKRRYEDEEVLLGVAGAGGGAGGALGASFAGLDYRQALLASGNGGGAGGGQLGTPFNGPPAEATSGALQAAVDAVIDGKDQQPLQGAVGGGQPMVLVPASQVPGMLGASGGSGVVMPMPGQWGA